MNETEKTILETQKVIINQLIALSERMITICQDVKTLLISELATEKCMESRQDIIDKLTKQLCKETTIEKTPWQRKKIK
ncbi:MAG: hypothetical protein LBE13_00480 [Bacteroidales bacterium]|jgi:hypothetical protein|nr:hypothetical protein [Bacteroidales bacterium]